MNSLIVLYLDIRENQYIPTLVYSRPTEWCINVNVRLNVLFIIHKISHVNTRSH